MILFNPFDKKSILRSHLAPLQKIRVVMNKLRGKHLFSNPLFEEATLDEVAIVRQIKNIEYLQNHLTMNPFKWTRSLNNRA
jgi:hypothetical protein